MTLETLETIFMNVLMMGLIVATAVVIACAITVGIYFFIKGIYLDFKKTKRSDNK